VVDTTTPAGGVAGDARSFAFTSVAPVASALAGNLLTLRIETDSFAGIQFTSLENPTYGAAALTIDYDGTTMQPVPLPAGAVLLLGGLGALARGAPQGLTGQRRGHERTQGPALPALAMSPNAQRLRRFVGGA
jgi:hypothetical protein